MNSAVQAYGIIKPGCYDVDDRNVMTVGTVHLGRYVTDVLLDFPDTFASATATAEEGDVAGVCLRVVCVNETQQSGFAGSIPALQRPSFAAADAPVDVLEDIFLSVFQRHVSASDYFIGIQV